MFPSILKYKDCTKNHIQTMSFSLHQLYIIFFQPFVCFCRVFFSANQGQTIFCQTNRVQLRIISYHGQLTSAISIPSVFPLPYPHMHTMYTHEKKPTPLHLQSHKLHAAKLNQNKIINLDCCGNVLVRNEQQLYLFHN